MTRYSGEPYSANSPPRGREVVCAHGLRPEGGSRRTWQHGAVQLSAPPALLQSGLPSMGARTNPCLLARVLTRTSAYSHACLLARPIPPTQLGSVLSLVLPAPQTAHRSRYATFACATFLVLLAYGVRYGILSKKMYIPTSIIYPPGAHRRLGSRRERSSLGVSSNGSCGDMCRITARPYKARHVCVDRNAMMLVAFSFVSHPPVPVLRVWGILSKKMYIPTSIIYPPGAHRRLGSRRERSSLGVSSNGSCGDMCRITARPYKARHVCVDRNAMMLVAFSFVSWDVYPRRFALDGPSRVTAASCATRSRERPAAGWWGPRSRARGSRH